MTTNRFKTSVLFLIAAALIVSGCDSIIPEPVNVMGDVRISRTPGTSTDPSLVWTGEKYAVSWIDSDRSAPANVFFATVSAAGVKQWDEISVSPSGTACFHSSLVWTGTEFGVAWDDDRHSGSPEIYFARLNAAFVKQGDDKRVTSASGYSQWPSLVWTGAEYALAWDDYRDGNGEIYFARLNATGDKQGPDVRLTDAAGQSARAWLASADTGFGLVWEDGRNGNAEVYFARLGADGAKQAGTERRVTNAAGNSWEPSLAWTGSGFATAYGDYREGDWELYCSRLDPLGQEQGDDLPLTAAGRAHWSNSLVWTGLEYAAVWGDSRHGDLEIYFTRLNAAGDKIGGDVRLTTAEEDSFAPSLVWTGSEFGVAWVDGRDGNWEIYFARLYPDGRKR